MKCTDIVKIETLIVMFKASKNTLTNIIQKYIRNDICISFFHGYNNNISFLPFYL